MTTHPAGSPRPVIFGEVLFDSFADGNDILGGAPFNVAWHLQGFGLDPLFISSVGSDSHGRQVLSTMRDWGMDTSGVQIDAGHPTGRVQVSLTNGQPQFDILSDQAYDFIDAGKVLAALSGVTPRILYMGTLISRSPVSHGALGQLIEHHQPPVFLDINLRPPWWDQAGIVWALRQATWGKLNDDEVMTVVERKTSGTELIADAEALRRSYDMELLILTRGADGACLLDGAVEHCASPPPVKDLVDTVGAGDAFSAVTLLGILGSWPMPLILERALEFAAAVCRQQGATANNPELYRDMMARWGV